MLQNPFELGNGLSQLVVALTDRWGRLPTEDEVIWFLKDESPSREEMWGWAVHNHESLGRKGNCPACIHGMPDVENPDARSGCNYAWFENSIDSYWICVRHGFFPRDTIEEGSTEPCRAIIRITA